mmetsp:Transcript_21187/g.24180  ORF Transcript_21187/g.24180 Transcript_21187/m.24180 type:complete len:240 (+) Transcript_21187:797-1516(+)
MRAGYATSKTGRRCFFPAGCLALRRFIASLASDEPYSALQNKNDPVVAFLRDFFSPIRDTSELKRLRTIPQSASSSLLDGIKTTKSLAIVLACIDASPIVPLNISVQFSIRLSGTLYSDDKYLPKSPTTSTFSDRVVFFLSSGPWIAAFHILNKIFVTFVTIDKSSSSSFCISIVAAFKDLSIAFAVIIVPFFTNSNTFITTVSIILLLVLADDSSTDISFSSSSSEPSSESEPPLVIV